MVFLRTLYNTHLIFLLVIVLEKTTSEREIGLEDFAEIRPTKNFVDKTEMIKVLFDKPSILITAPRHFGKSVNFDMVSLFLRNDQNKSEIEEIFKGTKIWSDKKFVENHMTNHPVLYCNFDTGLEVTCEESLLCYYRQILFGVYIEHEYLIDSPVINEEERKNFSRYINENEDLEKPEILQGLQFIIKTLFLHHDKKVIVLIDEYDAIIVNDLFFPDNYTCADYTHLSSEIMKFHIELFSSAFKNAHHIKQILITGTLPVEFMNEPSSISIHPIAFMNDKDLLQFYGFTSREVNSLIKRFRLPNNESELMLKWYDGYSDPKSSIHIFNPWSITKFLDLKFAFGYWVQVFPIRNILFPLMDNISIQERVVKLVNSELITVKLREMLSIEDLKDLKRIINKKWEGITDFDIFFQFLFQVGYLTYGKSHNHLPKTKVALVIPNKEIREELSTIIKKYFSHRLEGDK